MSRKVLEGTKVLEYSSFVSGPFCSKLLADLGADVIKIEEPGKGDEARSRGPFKDDIPNMEKSGLFLYLNTNKKGITLNPDSVTGKKIFLELVKWADILIEDKPPKMMSELELSYDTIKEVNPRLVMTSITPFGQYGPYRDYKAYLLNSIQGAGGGYLCPGASPNADREPTKGGGLFDDYSCGLNAAVGTLAAYYHSVISGKGQHVDISKQEALMTYDRVEIDLYPNTGKIANRLAGGSTASKLHKTTDGYVLPMTVLEHQWTALTGFMGNPDWTKDEMFSTKENRDKYAKELEQKMTEWLKDCKKDEVYHGGQAKGAPVAMVTTSEDVMKSEQSKARGLFVEVHHPEAGSFEYPSAPYIFSESSITFEQPAPLLGQHNEYVYLNILNYTREDLVRLRGSGII